MIKNYFIVALRNLFRNRNYSFINVLGLSVGLTSCIIIFLLIRHDLRFDKFHFHFDKIYRVVRNDLSASGINYESVTPYPFGAAFREDFPDIPLATQLHYHAEGFISPGDEKHKVKHIVFADSLFFSVFDFEVITGNPAKDLGEPNKVFLTKSLAEKYKLESGSKFKLDNKLELEVVGLVQDPPAHSHIRYSMIVSMPSFTKDFFGWPVTEWGLNSAGYSYVVLPDGVSPSDVEERFKAFVDKYYNPEEAKRNTFLLQPLGSIHFDKQYIANPSDVDNAEITDLMALGILGVFILAIACINFINLATALAVKKSREIGIRKTLGARRSQLSVYFLSETLFVTLLAVLISLGLVEWTLPWLRGFVERELEMNLFSDPSLIVFLMLLVIIATLFSGFYPAIILSGFDPVAVLKNKISARGSSGSTVRRILVVFQFIIAQGMIIATLVISDQMNFFRSTPLGFNYSGIVNVPLPRNDEDVLKNLQDRLLSIPSVQDVTFAVGAPTSNSNIGTGFYLTEKGPQENYSVGIKTVDYRYREAYGISMKAGRWFYESEAKRAADTTITESERHVYVVNEAAVRKLGFESAEDILDKRISIGLNDISAPVVGVTEDFHTSSLRQEIKPVVMIVFPSLYYDAGIRISTDNIQATLKSIEKTWSDIYPDFYFEYKFLDDHLASLYRQEERTFTLFKVFSGIAIFIGCLGLYGLISFMANQKVKEVGIRKVLGASASNIVGLFSREFLLLIGIAFMVAAPVSWYFMDNWLQGFTYHIDISVWVFVIGFLATALIALLTVSYRSIRAAVSNPVDALRAE